MAGEPADDRGTTIPLLIGLAVVLVSLVAVVTDATSAFVRREGLDNLADGAALQGADLGSAATAAYRGGDDSDRLRQTESAARAAVEAYLRQTGAYGRYRALTVRVSVDGADRSVQVRLRAVVDLPLGVPGVVRRAPVTATGIAAVARDD